MISGKRVSYLGEQVRTYNSVSSGGLVFKHPALGANGRRFEPRKRSKLFQDRKSVV